MSRRSTRGGPDRPVRRRIGRRRTAALTAVVLLVVAFTASFPAGGSASADETPAPFQSGGFIPRTTAPRIPTPPPDPEVTAQPPVAEPTVPEPTQPEPTPEPISTPEPTPEPVPTPAPTPATAAEVSDCEPGQTALVPTVPTVIAQIGVEQAWTVSTGQGIVVAVVDSGVDGANPHLTHALVDGVDLTGTAEATTDVDGLGTAVAGVISGRTVSGSGLKGVAHDAAIMPVRVLTDTSMGAVEAGNGPRADRTAAGIIWAADNGAQIVVVPRALVEGSAELASAVEYATGAGALVVGASGDQPRDSSAGAASAGPTGGATGDNDDDAAGAELSTNRYPAAYEGVLGVTALDSKGAVSDAVLPGDDVDVSVPAQAVLTAFFGDGDCVVSQQAPSSALAAGYAGAAAALVASAHRAESPADWAYRLTVTALRTSPAQRSPNTGWGLIAPFAAIEFVNDGTALGPTNPRGTQTKAAPAVVMATPPSTDPAPARRRRLAAGVGAVGTTALLVAMIASKTGNRTGRPGRVSGGGRS